jgi:hypothetical protein
MKKVNSNENIDDSTASLAALLGGANRGSFGSSLVGSSGNQNFFQQLQPQSAPLRLQPAELRQPQQQQQQFSIGEGGGTRQQQLNALRQQISQLSRDESD